MNLQAKSTSWRHEPMRRMRAVAIAIAILVLSVTSRAQSGGLDNPFAVESKPNIAPKSSATGHLNLGSSVRFRTIP